MVLIFQNYCRQLRLTFLVSALLCVSSVQISFGTHPQIQSNHIIQQDKSVFLFSKTVGFIALTFQDAGQILEPSQSESADVTSGLPFSYVIYGLLLSVTLFSIFRWRDKITRREARNADIKESKKKPEIGAVARKLQQRLPENRIVRDRMSSTAPRIRSKPAEAFTASPFSKQRHPNNNPKILIIDESQDMRAALVNQLYRYYSALESDDFSEAIRIARIAQPSLIILGTHSAKKESVAFCRKLKSDSSLWHIPILSLVSNKNKNDAAQLIKVTDDHLTAPLQAESLLVSVENLVDVRGYLKEGGLQRPRINGEDSTTQISDTMFLDAVHTVVENNLSNSLFGLETLGQEVNVSIRQLHGRLRQLTRLSPAGFIRTKRLKQASDLLASGKHNVQEIARMVGFHSPEYFHRVFKQAFGVAPTEYRRS